MAGGGAKGLAGRQVRETVPRSAALIETFRGEASRREPGKFVLKVANDLVANHRQQWHAEDASRASTASAVDVAATKRRIDELNARRVALVEQIDIWVARWVSGRADVPLHTETLGSVVDRLAIAWVRADFLVNAADLNDRARWALRQLVELAGAYDDLVRDVAAGHRRLPVWRSLKTYLRTANDER